MRPSGEEHNYLHVAHIPAFVYLSGSVDISEGRK